MSGPVLWKATLDPREGLLSLIVNTATRNLLPSAHAIIQQVGAAHAHNPTVALDPDLDCDALARILRQSEADVAVRWHRPADAHGYVDSFGCSVRTDEVGFRTRRFGPSATGTAPVARALWSLKTVPCCTEHWEYLVDACACGTVQRWQSADRLDRCDACNARLADTPAIEVDPALRDELAFIIGLLDPDPSRRGDARSQVPAELAELDGGEILELALAVMPLASGGYRPIRGSFNGTGAEQIEYATALAAAADMVRGWPATFLAALEAEVVTLSRSSSNPRYVGVADYVPAMASPMLLPKVRTAVLDALAPITAASGRVPRDQMGMKEAQRTLGLPVGVFSDARRQGSLWTRVCLRAGRFVATLDRLEMERVRSLKDNRVSAESAADGLDLPGYAISLLDDAGLIAIESHPFVVARYGNPQVHGDELSAFKSKLVGKAAAVVAEDDRLADTLRAVIEAPVPLHRVARAMGGGLTPWGDIFDRLITGSVRFAISARRASRIWIGAADAEIIRSLAPTMMGSARFSAKCSQRDAIEILNLPLRKVAPLERLARPNDRWEMEWDAVLSIAKERITLAEMCARTGMQSKTLLAKLDPLGLRSDDFGWWRHEALGALNDLS